MYFGSVVLALVGKQHTVLGVTLKDAGGDRTQSIQQHHADHSTKHGTRRDQEELLEYRVDKEARQNSTQSHDENIRLLDNHGFSANQRVSHVHKDAYPLFHSESESAVTAARKLETRIVKLNVSDAVGGGDANAGEGIPHITMRILSGQLKAEGFGRGSYSDDKLMTWQEFLSKTEHIGKECEADKAESTCGSKLVCRKGLCSYCQRNKECGKEQKCVFSLDGKHKCHTERTNLLKDFFTDPWEFLCTVLIFASSVMSAAAGVGGGGIFVPLLIALSGLQAMDAMPLSQVMIVFSSIVNLCLFLGQHMSDGDRAKIDYNCAALLEPMLVLGVTLGVLINRMAPQWLLTVLLALTLGFAFQRTFVKARKQYTSEKSLAYVPEPEAVYTWRELLRGHRDAVVYWTNRNYRALSLIMLVWLLVFFAQYGQHAFLKTCSWKFVAFLLATCATLVLFTLAIRRWGLMKEETKNENEIQWVGDSSGSGYSNLYPLIGLGAGTLGGLLGIGGGIIMSPVLLELGMHPERVQATTACFVFLSSTMASIQFALMGAYNWQYVCWYGSVTICATIVGQYMCDVYVRRSRRYSMITFSIAGVLAFSLIFMCCIGFNEAIDDYNSGANMGISWKSFCNGSGQGIFTVDVVPSPVLHIQTFQPWVDKATFWKWE